MKVGIIAKADMPDRVAVAREAVELLQDRADVVVKDELGKEFPGLAAMPLRDMKVDVLFTIGGDGTILYAMQQCDAPVFGVNMGELGFLTEVEPVRIKDAVEALVRGQFHVEERLKVATWVNDRRIPDAVNEAVVKTAHPSKLLALNVTSNKELIDNLRADGIIMATPTGSTSYAMSAGGPIVDPRIEAIIMVPIAAFKLGARPFVFPSTAKVEVRLPARAKEAVLVADGQHEEHLAGGDAITFTGSEHRARFLRLTDRFYSRLRERLVR